MSKNKDNPMHVFFKQGSIAFTQGRLDRKGFLAPNPYNQGTVKHKEWERGFNSAYAENIKRKLTDVTRK